MQPYFWTPSWQEGDAEIKKSNLVYNGFYQVTQFTLRHRCFSGEWSPWLTREQIRTKEAAGILLFDPKQDAFILVEQFRVGVFKWLLEVAAGLLDEGETPALAAAREAKEETGCTLLDLHEIATFYNSPGGFAEKTHLFLGITEVKHQGGIFGLQTEQEDIRVHVLKTQAVLDALEHGQYMTSAPTMIALQWFKLNKNQLYSHYR